MTDTNMKKKNWKQKLYHEFIRYWMNVLYMALFFGIFTNYRRLILAHYNISYEDYGVSIIKALVLAKVVLIMESLHIGRGFEDRPLFIPTIYKALLFTLCVALFNIIETMVLGFVHGKGLMGAVDELLNKYTYEWLAGALVIFFSFIPFFAVRELGRVLGEGTLSKMFFQKREAAKSDPDGLAHTLEK
jgi:hypothetical protein